MSHLLCAMCGMSDMGLARSRGVVLDGVAGVPVDIEVHVGPGLPSVGIVGLPGASVNEARWRIRSAVQNSGYAWPDSRVTISLSPAELPKHGAGLDLPMAVAILAAQGGIPRRALTSTALIGELALDGSVHPVRGALALAVGVVPRGSRSVVVPVGNLAECSVLAGVDVFAVDSLRGAIRVLSGEESPVGVCDVPQQAEDETLDFADVVGQSAARWAVEVAAAGRHHVLLTGSPGIGKTMIAERLPGLLPDLAHEAAREVTAIHSVAGLTHTSLVRRPPVQSPHCSASAAAILGTTRRSGAVPGAVTLAHRGVLFLDEAPEFHRDVIEGLRQPLESRCVSLHRAGWVGTLPADVQVVLAANPCPCGYFNDPAEERCTCGSLKVRSYQARVSGAVRSRIDIGVHMTAQGRVPMVTGTEGTATVRDRVAEARERAAFRLRPFGCEVNALVPGRVLEEDLGIEEVVSNEIDRLRTRGLRGAHRALRVAWSIADLRGHASPTLDDVDDAISLYTAAQAGARP